MLMGYAMCGSFCTFERSLKALERLSAAGHEIIPIMSQNAYETDTRFGRASMIRERVAVHREIVHTIAAAEPFGAMVNRDFALYRKHAFEACKRNHRHSGHDGGKGAASLRSSGSDRSGQQRRDEREFIEYRNASLPQGNLFCPNDSG